MLEKNRYTAVRGLGMPLAVHQLLVSTWMVSRTHFGGQTFPQALADPSNDPSSNDASIVVYFRADHHYSARQGMLLAIFLALIGLPIGLAVVGVIR